MGPLPVYALQWGCGYLCRLLWYPWGLKKLLFIQFNKEATYNTWYHNLVNGGFETGAYTCCAKFISTPWLEESRVLLPGLLHHHINYQLIKHHVEGVPLGNPLSTHWGFRIYHPWTEDEDLYAMPIAVEEKVCASGTPVMDRPHHVQPWEVVESILGVSK